MLTTFGFQVAFFSLCAVIVTLALGSIIRRKRRERLLAQRPREELHRLDRLQRELQETEHGKRGEVATTDTPAVSILKPEATAPAAPVPSSPTSITERTINADGMPAYRPIESAATTWQDRTLFGSQTQSNWRGSPAIPRLEPHEVPTVDTSDYVYGSATPILASFLPENEASKSTLARELNQAGDYAPHARENLAATRFLFMIGSLLLGGVCVLLAPPALERILLIGTAAMTGLGWALPSLMVKSRAKSRRTEVELAIPDMMDMLNMCVCQGLTVPDSLTRIARDLKPVYPALAQELSIAVDQAKVGTLTEALQNFANRIDLPQVDSFTSLLTQTERMGTSVSEALTDYSDTMRESLRQRADERANQASFSLLFPTVLCLMPAVFMFLMGPAVIELSKFTNAGGLGGLDEQRAVIRGANRQQTRGGGGNTTGGGQP
ncbi:MAG: type II secretion system F family protein [Planctomycetaceae bacterium]|nr:type II secretion system F family protein [Planctomycetaceae bacterium]